MNPSLNQIYYPTNYPVNMIGTFTYKIIQKTSFVKSDGTCALYLQVFINKNRKQIPLHISVPPKDFDKKNQLIKKSNAYHKDYNLIIGKKKAVVNDIRISYRLSGRNLTLDSFIEDYTNPSSKLDFIKFYKNELTKQLDNKVISLSTWKQQNATLEKLKRFKKVVLFYELDEDFIDAFKAYLKTKENNLPNTIYTALKNVKKYLRIAAKKRINMPLDLDNLKVKTIKGNRTFLTAEEINKLYKFWKSEFINESYKKVLNKFLFACFTGLRISDVKKINEDNFLGDFLIFSAEKTNKLQKIQLNQTALKFISLKNPVFKDNFEDQTINDYLKEICKICGITKKVSFHVARHTFATQFLISGGKVEVLQKILGHSKIETTMVYVHIVEAEMCKQINNLDKIIN